MYKGSNLRILYITNDLPAFCQHRLGLLEFAVNAGATVTLFSGGQTTGYADKLPQNVKLSRIDLDQHKLQLFSDFAVIATIYREIRHNTPDVIHALTIKPNLFTSIAIFLFRMFNKHNIRLVMTFPGLGKVFEPTGSYSKKLRRKLVVSVMKYCLKNQDYVATFENPADRDYIVTTGAIRRQKTRVLLGTGINFDEYHNKRGKRRIGPLRFLFASRLLKAKGVGIFISAAEHLHKAGILASFAIAGPLDATNPDVTDEGNITRAAQAGWLDYLGHVTPQEMPALMRSVDVVCLPTKLHEGFPRVLIEAAAAGCALIASDQPSIRQIVAEERTGWLLNSGQESSLVNAIIAAVNAPEKVKKYGMNAAKFSRSLGMDERSISKKFFTIYQER